MSKRVTIRVKDLLSSKGKGSFETRLVAAVGGTTGSLVMDFDGISQLPQDAFGSLGRVLVRLKGQKVEVSVSNLQHDFAQTLQFTLQEQLRGVEVT